MDFIDTNIIVYANDRRDPRKQERAVELVRVAMIEGSGMISTQILQEYAGVATRKLGQSAPVVIHQLHLLESLRVVQVAPAMVRRALELSIMYGLSYWDSLVVSAAEAGGCDRLLSEDLGDGQVYCGISCVNPFLAA